MTGVYLFGHRVNKSTPPLRPVFMSIYYPDMWYRNLLSLIFGMWLVLGCSEPSPPTINLQRAVEIGDLDQLERNLHFQADVNEPGPTGLTHCIPPRRKGAW